MILQGQDIPIHLGSLIPAMKAVADFFGDDLHEGDIIYHNDPVYQGSHILDCCMYKPVFHEGELVFWAVCKGHLTDIGGRCRPGTTRMRATCTPKGCGSRRSSSGTAACGATT